MTNDRAIAMTVMLLEHFFGVDECRWHVRIVPEIPGHPDKGGACDDRRQRIILVERCLADDRNAARIILHEVAHAITPPHFEAHGAEFEAAQERVGAYIMERVRTRLSGAGKIIKQ